jgi:hypothetical protein
MPLLDALLLTPNLDLAAQTNSDSLALEGTNLSALPMLALSALMASFYKANEDKVIIS